MQLLTVQQAVLWVQAALLGMCCCANTCNMNCHPLSFHAALEHWEEAVQDARRAVALAPRWAKVRCAGLGALQALSNDGMQTAWLV